MTLNNIVVVISVVASIFMMVGLIGIEDKAFSKNAALKFYCYDTTAIGQRCSTTLSNCEQDMAFIKESYGSSVGVGKCKMIKFF